MQIVTDGVKVDGYIPTCLLDFTRICVDCLM